MICNLCGVNESTIHLTEIVNEQMIEIHLCETCAQEKGTEFKTHFNVNDLLAGLTDPAKWVEGLDAVGIEQTPSKCSHCGMSYEEFGKKGRLGCSSCYISFERLLMPIIRRVQRSVTHAGKKPARGTGAAAVSPDLGDLKLLQQRLRRSIQAEEFEEAADIRDQIRKIEEKLAKHKVSNPSSPKKPKEKE